MTERTGKPIRSKVKAASDYFKELNRLAQTTSSSINEFLEERFATEPDLDETIGTFFEQLIETSAPDFGTTIRGLGAEMSITHNNQFSRNIRELYGVDVTALIQAQGLEEALDDAVNENVTVLQNEFFEKTRNKIANIISRALVNGENENQSLFNLLIEGIPKKATRIDPITKKRVPIYISPSRLKFVARDQTQRFTGMLTRVRQQGAGIKTYKWSSSRDERVRKSHRALNGLTIEWATGKVVDAPSGKKKYIGRTTAQIIKSLGGSPSSDGIHPQQGYNCRCVALPVIEIQETRKVA